MKIKVRMLVSLLKKYLMFRIKVSYILENKIIQEMILDLTLKISVMSIWSLIKATLLNTTFYL